MFDRRIASREIRRSGIGELVVEDLADGELRELAGIDIDARIRSLAGGDMVYAIDHQELVIGQRDPVSQTEFGEVTRGEEKMCPGSRPRG